MSRAASPGGGGPCGLARVCRVWRVARAAVHRRRPPPPTRPTRRPGPVGPMLSGDMQNPSGGDIRNPATPG